MFPTQETATSADTALSQGEHQRPYPTMVQRIADLLRKPRELMARQREDSHLLGKVRDLNNGGTGGEYVTDDDGLLWYAPPGSILRLAIPCSLVPGVLAFVHTTYGHPEVARTTELTQGKYHRTFFKSDVRNYSKVPPANVSPCYQPASSNPGKSSRWISTTTWERGLRLGIDTFLLKWTELENSAPHIHYPTRVQKV